MNASGWTFANWTDGADTITLNGGEFNDTITGTAQRDMIDGGNGDDVLRGGSGNDVLRGGSGNDEFTYFATTDLVAGESIDGGAGNSDEIVLKTDGAHY